MYKKAPLLPVLSLSESLTLSPPSAQRHLSDQDSACGQRPLTLRLRRAVTHYGRHCFPARLDMPGLFAICEGGRRRSLWAWGGKQWPARTRPLDSRPLDASPMSPPLPPSPRTGRGSGPPASVLPYAGRDVPSPTTTCGPPPMAIHRLSRSMLCVCV